MSKLINNQMPTYVFKDNLSGRVFEKYLGMTELDRFKQDYPHLTQVPTILNAVGSHYQMKN